MGEPSPAEPRAFGFGRMPNSPRGEIADSPMCGTPSNSQINVAAFSRLTERVAGLVHADRLRAEQLGAQSEEISSLEQRVLKLCLQVEKLSSEATVSTHSAAPPPSKNGMVQAEELHSLEEHVVQMLEAHRIQIRNAFRVLEQRMETRLKEASAAGDALMQTLKKPNPSAALSCSTSRPSEPTAAPVNLVEKPQDPLATPRWASAARARDREGFAAVVDFPSSGTSAGVPPIRAEQCVKQDRLERIPDCLEVKKDVKEGAAWPSDLSVTSDTGSKCGDHGSPPKSPPTLPEPPSAPSFINTPRSFWTAEEDQGLRKALDMATKQSTTSRLERIDREEPQEPLVSPRKTFAEVRADMAMASVPPPSSRSRLSECNNSSQVADVFKEWPTRSNTSTIHNEGLTKDSFPSRPASSSTKPGHSQANSRAERDAQLALNHRVEHAPSNPMRDREQDRAKSRTDPTTLQIEPAKATSSAARAPSSSPTEMDQERPSSRIDLSCSLDAKRPNPNTAKEPAQRTTDLAAGDGSSLRENAKERVGPVESPSFSSLPSPSSERARPCSGLSLMQNLTGLLPRASSAARANTGPSAQRSHAGSGVVPWPSSTATEASGGSPASDRIGGTSFGQRAGPPTSSVTASSQPPRDMPSRDARDGRPMTPNNHTLDGPTLRVDFARASPPPAASMPAAMPSRSNAELQETRPPPMKSSPAKTIQETAVPSPTRTKASGQPPGFEHITGLHSVESPLVPQESSTPDTLSVHGLGMPDVFGNASQPPLRTCTGVGVADIVMETVRVRGCNLSSLISCAEMTAEESDARDKDARFRGVAAKVGAPLTAANVSKVEGSKRVNARKHSQSSSSSSSGSSSSDSSANAGEREAFRGLVHVMGSGIKMGSPIIDIATASESTCSPRDNTITNEVKSVGRMVKQSDSKRRLLRAPGVATLMGRSGRSGDLSVSGGKKESRERLL